MVSHTFVCDSCRVSIEDTNTKTDHLCFICRKPMRWDLKGVGIAPGDYHHVSDSLAINPDQISEHKQAFPDVDVLPDGRLEFNSFGSHDKYLTKTGFVKKTQKLRRKFAV